MVRRNPRVLLLIGLCCLVSAVGPQAAAGQTFYVAPGGDDANPGTQAKPFATITRARDEVRKINRDMTEDVVVVLRGGTYRIDGTITLDHRDSGGGGHNVVYRAAPGETPVISGGQPITGWQPDAGGRWKAATPIDNFRQLYVGGVRAVRARGGPLPDVEMAGEDGHKTSAAEMADWGNQEDVELLYYVMWGQVKAWTHTRCKVKKITRDGDHALLTMLQPYFTEAKTKEGVRVKLPYAVQNAMELLDEPGEWYLDRAADTVYYIPRAGEDMKTVEVIAPVVEKLLELRGTLDEPVNNIRFEGVTFADAGWLNPSRVGLIDVQANFINDPEKPLKRDGVVTTVHNEHIKSPANVVCRAVRGVRFERCTFTRLGGAALDLEFGAQDNVVSGCRFFDISGTAIQLGDVLTDDHHPDDPRAVVKNNRIVNSSIHDACLEYQGGVGIFAGYTDSTTIAHNEIYNLPYSGVSIGWGWGEEDAGGGNPAYHQPFRYDTPSTAKNNVIELNHIHDVMQVLNDGAGIYTLGNQPGTVIRRNHIHDNMGAKLGNTGRGVPGGIYMDEGSGFIEATENVIYNVVRPMNFNNRAQNRIATCNVHDNFFDHRPGGQMLCPGKVGKALNCDGVGAFVEVPHSDRLEPQQMTIEAWVKISEYTSGEEPRRWIVNKNTHELTQSHYALFIDRKMVGAYLNIGGCNELWSSDVLVLDRWQQLAMTYDGKVLRVYCDGKEAGSLEINKQRVPGKTPLHIGRRQDGHNYFKGGIDEVRFYDRALAAEEIKANYDAVHEGQGKTISDGLVGHWGFDEPAKTPEAVQKVIAEAGLEPAYR